MEFVRLQNTEHGNIPDYWNVPLNSYNTELCFVARDSVVAAPKLLLRTIFPELDAMLCPGCVETHERVTVIIKDLEASEIVEAFKSLASGDPEHIARVLELQTSPNFSQETEIKSEQQIIEKQEQDEADHDNSTEKNLNQQKTYKCKFCNSMSSTNVANLNHMSEKHGTKIHSCEECEFVSKHHRTLRIHREKYHGFTVHHFPCNLCKYKARSEERLRVHKKTKCLEKKPEDESSGRLVSCEKCNFTARSKSQVKIHTTLKHTNLEVKVKPREKAFNSYVPVEKDLKARCSYCSYVGKNVSQHEEKCGFKDKTVQSYGGSMLFQDANFGWL